MSEAQPTIERVTPDRARAAVPAAEASRMSRGLALAAALAAALMVPGVLAGAPQGAAPWPLVLGLSLGAAALAGLSLLPQAQTLRALALTAYGGIVTTGVGLGLLLFGTRFAREADATLLLLAAAAALAWLAAYLLNRLEARRGFGAARRFDQWRAAGWALSMAFVLPPLAWLLGQSLFLWLLPRWQGTVLESLAGGLGWLAGLAFLAAAGGAALVLLPRAMARSRLRGRLSASAASEALWFGPLLVLALPWVAAAVALSGTPILLPAASGTPGDWIVNGAAMWLAVGELMQGPAYAPAPAAAAAADSAAWVPAALLAIMLAHGGTRLLIGRPRPDVPLPLLVLLDTDAPTPGARRFLSRLPGLWGAGPVTRIALPALALSDSGVHLETARRAGLAEALFVHGEAGLDAWQQALPPPPQWQALPAREAYVGATDWARVLQAWVTPQTVVLWLHDAGPPAPTLPPGFLHGLESRLAAARQVHGHLARAGDDSRIDPATPVPGTAGRSAPPRWQGAQAQDFVDWLRERVRPPQPRRIVVLHGTAQAELADRLATRLSGRHAHDGRFVQAVALGSGQPLSLLGLPLWVVALVVRAAADAGSTRGARLLADWWLPKVPRRPRASAADPPCHFVLLCSAQGDAGTLRTDDPIGRALLATGAQRVAVVLDARAELPPQWERRLDATGLNDGTDAARLERLVRQLLADEALDRGQPGPARAESPAPRGAADSTPPAAPPAAPEPVPAGQLVVFGLGLSETRIQALRECLTVRLGSSMRWTLRSGDEAQATALAGRSAQEAVLLIVGAQQPVAAGRFDELKKAAQSSGAPCWLASMGAQAGPGQAGEVEPLPTDWSADDPVAEANLGDWADALAADLGRSLSTTAAAPRVPGALCLAAIGTPGRLLVGRREGWLRWGTEWRHEHRGDLRALLELSDGRIASVDDTTLWLWQGRSPLARIELPRHPRALAELREDDGRLSIVIATHAHVLLVVTPDDTDPASAVREVELPNEALSVAALPTDGRSGWVAVAGDSGLQRVHIGHGESRRLSHGRGAQPAQHVATWGERLFFGGADALGNGLVGLHPGNPDRTRPIVLGGWRAPVTALLPLAPAELLFGDRLGGLWHWWPERGANRVEPVAQVGGAVQAIALAHDRSVTVLAGQRIYGAGTLGDTATEPA